MIKKILVTGANRGLGLGLVKKFLRNNESQQSTSFFLLLYSKKSGVHAASKLLAIS